MIRLRKVVLGKREIVCMSSYEAHSYIRAVKTLIEQLDKPFILNAATLENRILDIPFYIDDAMFAIIYHAFWDELVKITGHNNLWNIVEHIADEDIAWGEWRNKDLLYKSYYKYTLKQEFQEQIRSFLIEWLTKLEKVAQELETEEREERENREQFKKRFSVVKTHKLVYPKGGEFGIDGYADLELEETESKNRVRMVARNVFDFGYYCYPKRLEGTEQIFRRSTWTEEEKLAEKWLHEFPPFTTAIRM